MIITEFRHCNPFTYHFRGDFSLTAGAAVGAIRGDEYSVTKTGVGAYRITIETRGINGVRAVEVINRAVEFGESLPATATACQALNVVNAANGDIQFNLVTVNAALAPTDTTAATAISWNLSIRDRVKI